MVDTNTELARACARVEAEPRNAHAWLGAARAMIAAGATDDALVALRTATQIAPDLAAAWVLYGVTAARKGWIHEPIGMLERACGLAPMDVEAHILLGQLRLGADRTEAARQAFETALALDAQATEAMAGLARCRERSGDLKGARSATRRAAKSPAPAAQVALAWASASRGLGKPADGVVPVQRALKATRDPWLRTLLNHELGECELAAGNPEAAVRAHTQANHGRLLSFDPDALVRDTDHRIACDLVPSTTRHQGSQPLLVVGLPRSGTTLMDRVLAGHPDIRSAGELHTLTAIDRERRTRGLDLDTARAAYARQLGTGPERFVVDKMPDNTLQLGLAGALGMGARAIWMLRDPVDTLWSCFRQPFSDGLPWTTRLEWLTAVWTERMRLLDHVRRHPPVPLHIVRYEDLVTRPEPTIRAVLDFLDLPFHADCLTPHRTGGPVATASALQVREPLHTRYIGRSRPVEPFLAELVALRGAEPFASY